MKMTGNNNLIEKMISKKLLTDARRLSREVASLTFGPPVASVYNPLEYAWRPYRAYIEKYASAIKRVIFVGMNPGPWGMAQVGVPFGEISFVRDWLGIEEKVDRPEDEHTKRPVLGFSCDKSEVSGKRLWGLFEKRFRTPEIFFKDHIVLNYCPLVFMEKSGKNITPDKLPRKEQEQLFPLCDGHLQKAVSLLQPEWIIGVGNFVEKRLNSIFMEGPIKTGKILHPSPASPAANRDWAGTAVKQLKAMGVWR